MTTSEQVRVLCVRSGISLSELARKLQQSPQNFISKLKRDTLTYNELTQIAQHLGASYERYFMLSNGDIIK